MADSTLTLAAASAIVDAALDAGAGHGFKPLTVVVLDAGGHIVAAKRSDGSGILRIEIAFGKAYGALGVGVPSRTLGVMAIDRPHFGQALAVAAAGRMVPVAGGVLIRDGDGTVIGAVGVSGDTSDNDELAAIRGVEAARLTPDPATAVEG